MLPDDVLRANEIRLRTLATRTAAVLWHTDSDGAALGDNLSWEAFTGQSRSDAAGLGWLASIHPDDRAQVVESWRAGVASRALVEMRYRLRRADGVYRDMEVQGVPVFEGDAVREWVGICIDVTERKLAKTSCRRARSASISSTA